MITTTTLTRITVSVGSLERARALYEKVLGLPLIYEMPGMAMLALDDARIELQLHERTPTPGDAAVALSFGVHDVDTMTDAAVTAGATVIHGPADQEWGERQTVLCDADGHVFCLVAPTPDE